MINFENYIKALDYLDVMPDGVIYRKERVWNNNGGTQTQPRRICPEAIDGSGYSYIRIFFNGKQFNPKVHVLVVLKYKGLPENENMQVDHLDGNKQNNSIDNLEWVTPSENSLRAYKNGLHVTSDYERYCKRKRMQDNNPMKNNETAKKVSESKKGKALSDEHRKRISKGLKGKKTSIETKIKLGKSICAYDENGIILNFITMREADRNGFNRSSIANAIKNNKRYKGYNWSYVLY